MHVAAPITTAGGSVLPAWIDENGHMNVAFYLKCFDDAFYDVFPLWAVRFTDTVKSGYSQFIAQANVRYLQEMLLDDRFRIESQLIDFDRKRTRWYMRMLKDDGSLAATCEFLCLIVGVKERKVASMPDAWFERLSALRVAHADLPVPADLGGGVAMLRRYPL